MPPEMSGRDVATGVLIASMEMDKQRAKSDCARPEHDKAIVVTRIEWQALRSFSEFGCNFAFPLQFERLVRTADRRTFIRGRVVDEQRNG